MSVEPVPHIVDERLLQILQEAHEGSAKDLAAEIKRLQARITSLEAEIAIHDVAQTNLARKLESCEAENQVLRFEHDRQAKRASEFQAHVSVLTESATETARRLQQCEAELTQVRIDAATLAQQRDAELRQMQSENITFGQENHRLRAERFVFATRSAELENHNRLLTEAATESERKLQAVRQADYQLVMAQQQLLAGMRDAEPRFHEIYERCRVYTMTSVKRLYALYKTVEYIVSAKLPGDLVEVGVWRGGSCMLIAETLLALGDSSRRIFLCDTFAGIPAPTPTRMSISGATVPLMSGDVTSARTVTASGHMCVRRQHS
jgi:hypothetical protein